MQQAFFNFTEGQLTFYFDPAHWQVRKYDDHTFFQGFSGVGLKGVDFVGIYNQNLLVLLEVKNYTWRNTPFREKDVKESLKNPVRIAAAVQQKMEDSLAGLRAIRIYYERKRSRSWSWLDRFRKPDTEQLFWEQVASLLEGGKVRCLLWMETEPEDTTFVEKIEQYLGKASVQDKYLVHLVRDTDYPYRDSWKMDPE